MVYTDINKTHTLFTGVSTYVWSTVLMQEQTNTIGDKTLVHQHPITYVSSLFQASLLN